MACSVEMEDVVLKIHRKIRHHHSLEKPFHVYTSTIKHIVMLYTQFSRLIIGAIIKNNEKIMEHVKGSASMKGYNPQLLH